MEYNEKDFQELLKIQEATQANPDAVMNDEEPISEEEKAATEYDAKLEEVLGLLDKASDDQIIKLHAEESPEITPDVIANYQEYLEDLAEKDSDAMERMLARLKSGEREECIVKEDEEFICEESQTYEGCPKKEGCKKAEACKKRTKKEAIEDEETLGGPDEEAEFSDYHEAEEKDLVGDEEALAQAAIALVRKQADPDQELDDDEQKVLDILRSKSEACAKTE